MARYIKGFDHEAKLIRRQTNAAALVEKLRQVARDFSERPVEDSSLPTTQRQSMSLLRACRAWYFSAERMVTLRGY
jgi:hypothetical protein